MATPPGPGMLMPDVQQQLQSEMRTGERVVWSEQPPRAIVPVVVLTLFIVPFGLVFGGFPLFMLVIPAFTQNGFAAPPWPFGLFGLIFVLAGLAITTAPFWVWKNGGKIVYAVTNQRAIILSPRTFGGWTVQSFAPDRLANLTRSEKPDGTGSLVFEQFSERLGSGTHTVTRGFHRIARVREVEKLILDTLVAGRTR